MTELIRARDKNAIASQYTMADALFSASFLNACLRHADDVGMANIAPIVNTRGPLYVHPKGLVKRTTFHVLAMYANLLRRAGRPDGGGQHSPGARRTNGADLGCHGDLRRAGRKWRIVLVNRHPSESVALRCELGGKTLDGKYRATVLAGDSPDAYNDVDRPNRVTPQTIDVSFTDGQTALPPHSVGRPNCCTGTRPRPITATPCSASAGPYLLDMEGRVVHTWPIGTNPHLLDNGNILDASKDDPSGFRASRR